MTADTNSARCYRRHQVRKAMAAGEAPSHTWDVESLEKATGLEAGEVKEALAGLVQAGRARKTRDGWQCIPWGWR